MLTFKKKDVKMSTIAIYRQAKNNQLSSLNHLFNTQEKTNQNADNNPNINNDNFCIYKDGDNLYKTNFKRNGSNDDIVKSVEDAAKNIDEKAREDYKQHKLKQKEENPSKKVRTVLQSKNLEREFVIALGGDKSITGKEDFEKKALNAVDAVLKAKGLTVKDNLLCLVIHYDEKTPHIHCKYNDYSFEYKTTSKELFRNRTDKDAPKQEKRAAREEERENFSQFQDIVADTMGMDRGQKNSKQKHLEKHEFYLQTIADQEKQMNNNANLLETRTKTNKDLMDGNQKLREEIEQQKIDIDSNNKLLEAQKKDIKPTSMLNLSVEQFERLEGKERVKIVNNLDKLINISKNNNDLVQAEYFEKLKKDFETLLFYFYGKVNKDKQKIQPNIAISKKGKDLEIS